MCSKCGDRGCWGLEAQAYRCQYGRCCYRGMSHGVCLSGETPHATASAVPYSTGPKQDSTVLTVVDTQSCVLSGSMLGVGSYKILVVVGRV